MRRREREAESERKEIVCEHRNLHILVCVFSYSALCEDYARSVTENLN